MNIDLVILCRDFEVLPLRFTSQEKMLDVFFGLTAGDEFDIEPAMIGVLAVIFQVVDVEFVELVTHVFNSSFVFFLFAEFQNFADFFFLANAI